ncbi:zf-Tim10_DDP domain-containing protein [Caerostris extrusa]|uniref:Mitochondrial import inner membrane translocase subunit n=1 Tax=Caerostris extrusa TaxID=172846 RepID=A0AAV4NP49_CAEEX|nr:zf-Tim10_DDP domain-containing protein [Caerostris extrusa]
MEDLDSDNTLNKMKDFLSIYNKMADTCFNHCVDDFNCRELTSSEESCIEKCSAKGVAVNHKLMMCYIDIQPEVINRRTAEMQKQENNLKMMNNANN